MDNIIIKMENLYIDKNKRQKYNPENKPTSTNTKSKRKLENLKVDEIVIKRNKKIECKNIGKNNQDTFINAYWFDIF